MNPVKREIIQQATKNYKKFKDGIEQQRLNKEIQNLMNRPWPFKIKTIELAKEKVMNDQKKIMTIYKTWYDDSIYLNLTRKVDLVESSKISVDDDELRFISSYKNITHINMENENAS